MRRPAVMIFLISLACHASAQWPFESTQRQSSHYLTSDISIIRGNGLLYVLGGDLISESLVTTVGINFSYKSNFSKIMYWSAGLSAYSLSSDFDLAPTGGDLENIVTSSKFLAVPMKIGVIKNLQAFSMEFGAGMEYAWLLAQREQNISTTRFIILEEEMVDLNRPIVQKNNLLIIASLIITTPISYRLSTYIGVEGRHGLSDLDNSRHEQKTNRYEFRFGIQYAL